MKHSSRPSQLALLLPAVVAAVALTACGREDDGRTAGQRLDDGISKMEQKSEEAKQDTRQAMDNMGNKMDRTADKVAPPSTTPRSRRPSRPRWRATPSSARSM
ncbi:hypothetical protein [Mitsuaria sp. TWR114]|uniref:hypothetical protein n=1 Tax=Mitsuaria sp. TWR114 TaxID=2601731 RepID=UPI0021055D31|nr:hypothetical protein [Mitsuaria sp. TWR114]